MSTKQQGLFYESQQCPYCQAKLVKHKNYLVCNFHKWAFPIINGKIVDYRLSAVVKNYDRENKQI